MEFLNLKKIGAALVLGLSSVSSLNAQDLENKLDKTVFTKENTEEKTQLKEYIHMDLKWFANQVDKRYQIGFDFSLYREYDILPLILYTDINSSNVIEPPGSFDEIREENTPEWQPHFQEFKFDLGIRYDIDWLSARLFFHTERKMFLDLPIDANQDYGVGVSLETLHFRDAEFESKEEFYFANNLEARLETGFLLEDGAFATLDLRYDIFQFQNAMIYVAGSANWTETINETDKMYHFEIGMRAENGTTLFFGVEKYKKVSPLFIVGIKLGGAMRW